MNGVFGPGTRQAIRCAEQKKGVSSRAQLYKALGLHIGHAAMRDSTGTSDSSSMKPKGAPPA